MHCFIQDFVLVVKNFMSRDTILPLAFHRSVLQEVLRLARREEIIIRIRKALHHPLDGSSVNENNLPPTSPPLMDILPTIVPQELLPKFEQELTKVAGVAHRAANRQALEEILQSIFTHAKATRVVLSRNPLLATLNIESLLQAWSIPTSVWKASETEDSPETRNAAKAFAQASFGSTVGITGVDFALAETGSLVVTSSTEGSQLASLAPPVHVALYRRNQLVASLDEVLQELEQIGAQEKTLPGRSVVFITGTSRTADIEQILIRGVHGPGELHAILVEEACF